MHAFPMHVASAISTPPIPEPTPMFPGSLPLLIAALPKKEGRVAKTAKQVWLNTCF